MLRKTPRRKGESRRSSKEMAPGRAVPCDGKNTGGRGQASPYRLPCGSGACEAFDERRLLSPSPDALQKTCERIMLPVSVAESLLGGCLDDSKSVAVYTENSLLTVDCAVNRRHLRNGDRWALIFRCISICKSSLRSCNLCISRTGVTSCSPFSLFHAANDHRARCGLSVAPGVIVAATIISATIPVEKADRARSRDRSDCIPRHQGAQVCFPGLAGQASSNFVSGVHVSFVIARCYLSARSIAPIRSSASCRTQVRLEKGDP